MQLSTPKCIKKEGIIKESHNFENKEEIVVEGSKQNSYPPFGTVRLYPLLYNGKNNLRKGRNKDRATVCVLFETDLYFSLS